MAEFTFRPLTDADLPALVRWQASPAASPWFGGPLTLDEARARYGRRIAGDDPVRMLVIHRAGRDIGYAQLYRVGDLPTPEPADPDAVGLDYVIGEPDLIGHGLGTRLIAALVELARWWRPGVAQIVACPDHRNVASARVLAKNGFTEGVWFDVPASLGRPPSTMVMWTLRV